MDLPELLFNISPSELDEDFVAASGPGGQNVNKVATAVQLRFDVANSPSLSHALKQRLIKVAGSRMTQDGILVIDARRYRTQEQNRRDARERLNALLSKATHVPKARRKTKPSRAAKQRRLDSKRQRSTTKKLRGRVRHDHD